MSTAHTTAAIGHERASAPAPRRARAGSLARALGLALAPMLLFLSIPVGLSGGFVLAWILLVASLVLVALDAALLGGATR